MGTVLSLGLYLWVWPWVLQSSCHCLKIPNINCYLDEYNIVVVLLLLNPTVPLRNYPLSWKILKLGLYFDCKQQKPCWKWLKQIGVLSSEKVPRSKQPGLLLASSSAILQTWLLQVGILVTFQAGRKEQNQNGQVSHNCPFGKASPEPVSSNSHSHFSSRTGSHDNSYL